MKMRFSTQRGPKIPKRQFQRILQGIYQTTVFGSSAVTLSPNAVFHLVVLSCRVIIQCTYPLAGLYRLFSVYKFESDTAGYGSIIRTTQPREGTLVCSPPECDHFLPIMDLSVSTVLTVGLQSPTVRPTVKPTTALKTTPAAQRRKAPVAYLPAVHPPTRYIKVSRGQFLFSGMRKGKELEHFSNVFLLKMFHLLMGTCLSLHRSTRIHANQSRCCPNLKEESFFF